MLTLMLQRIALAMVLAAATTAPRPQEVLAQPGVRDEHLEDVVAALFESARTEAGSKPLQRIRRADVEELVCTVSATNVAPAYKNGFPVLDDSPTRHSPNALYKTANPASSSDQLRRLAVADRNGRTGYRRFAVAVWSAQPPTSPPQYWVGIRFYYSAGAEFFEHHFTDAIYWKHEWKLTVISRCAHVSSK